MNKQPKNVLSLQKKSSTRQFESKLSLRSFAFSLHRQPMKVLREPLRRHLLRLMAVTIDDRRRSSIKTQRWHYRAVDKVLNYHSKTYRTMINYSIVKRSVNANLIEINQAKSRINQAKKEGKTPQPADLALVKTEKQNAFAVAQYTGVMNIDKFARHISSHGSVYSRADIAAILYLTVDCMREQLLEGKKIRLGDLGDFSVSLSSKGVEDPNAFNAQNITGVKVIWEPGAEFKSLRDDAEFNLVASRDAQAAVIKAIKQGKDNVDISKPASPSTGGTTEGGGSQTGGSTDNTQGGGGSQTGGGTGDGE